MSAREPRTLNEGRDLNPGDTRFPESLFIAGDGPLNEGRDLNPGDTIHQYLYSRVRSMSLNEGPEQK